MTENRATTSLSYAERQAQLALFPTYVQQALHASAQAAELAVHRVRLKHSEVQAMLGVLLQSDPGTRQLAGIDLCAVHSALLRLMPDEGDDACLENIGAATIEAAIPALQNALTRGPIR